VTTLNGYEKVVKHVKMRVAKIGKTSKENTDEISKTELQ
jgi:hypothetical protein